VLVRTKDRVGAAPDVLLEVSDLGTLEMSGGRERGLCSAKRHCAREDGPA
jgi:hypothetical protein